MQKNHIRCTWFNTFFILKMRLELQLNRKTTQLCGF